MKNPDDILDLTELEYARMSSRTYNIIKYLGAQTARDMAAFTAKELLKIPNFGKKSLNELMEWLQSDYDLTLATVKAVPPAETRTISEVWSSDAPHPDGDARRAAVVKYTGASNDPSRGVLKPTGQHIVLIGDIVTGFEAYGPFDSGHDAIEWKGSTGVRELAHGQWYLMQLKEPIRGNKP